MNATSANLIERVLPPQTGLRQWVLTFPFSWRRRTAHCSAVLTRIFVETVQAFYAERAAQQRQRQQRGGPRDAAVCASHGIAVTKQPPRQVERTCRGPNDEASTWQAPRWPRRGAG